MNQTNPWIDPPPCAPDDAVLAACDQDALLAAILLRRGFSDPARIRAFLSPDTYVPAAPEQLPDLEKASRLLETCLTGQQRILVWGDFDVDGQSSTALLVEALQRLGADVIFHLPDRATESHGIKPDALREQIEQHHPDVLITCDTGISEFDALQQAAAAGLPVIVTDHHELGDHLPPAFAVINPRRLPDHHPLATLPGVGVAYKLIQHLYTSLGRQRELPRFLDLVALGIVADVAQQTADTRYLLQVGMERLRHTERIGLLALMEVANVPPSTLTADQIGHHLGPRLNAAGRLGDASIGVQLMLSHQWAQARVLAQQLEGINSERRAQTSRIEVEALKVIEANPTLLDSAVLVVYEPDWHPGILGIIAARLAERYQRPVVLLSSAGDGGHEIARGSARSVPGYDIGHALANQADLLRTHGGHAGAAGLSLAVADIDLLRARLSGALANLHDMPTGPTPLRVDAVVSLDELTLDLSQRLQRLAPFGEGNPPVILATPDVALSRSAIAGFEQRHRRLTVEDRGGHQQTLMWWGGARETPPDGRFDIAYTLNISTNDRHELQLTLVSLRQREAPASVVVSAPLRLEDWRAGPDPLQRVLALLRAESEIAGEPGRVAIWAEAFSRQDYPDFQRRAELEPAQTLVIYSPPPDPQTLRGVLERVQPQTVIVCAAPPPLTTREAMLAQLHTAARNVIEQLDGKANPEVLYGAVGQSPAVVRAGLDFLVASGKLGSVTWRNKNTLVITPITSAATSQGAVDTSTSQARFDAAFREVEAFRRYFRSATLAQLRQLFSQ